MKIVSSFAHLHVITNLNSFIFSEYKLFFSSNYFSTFFHRIEKIAAWTFCFVFQMNKIMNLGLEQHEDK